MMWMMFGFLSHFLAVFDSSCRTCKLQVLSIPSVTPSSAIELSMCTYVQCVLHNLFVSSVKGSLT